MRTLRQQVGLTSAALANQLRPQPTATEVVHVRQARRPGAVLQRHRYDDDDCARRRGRSSASAQWLAEHPSARSPPASASGCCWPGPSRPTPASCCSTNRPPLRPARARAAPVAVVAGPRRESAPQVLVTHHLEEIPPGYTHALLAGAGRRPGPPTTTVTSQLVSACFALPVIVTHQSGRYAASLRRADRSAVDQRPPGRAGLADPPQAPNIQRRAPTSNSSSTSSLFASPSGPPGLVPMGAAACCWPRSARGDEVVDAYPATGAERDDQPGVGRSIHELGRTLWTTRRQLLHDEEPRQGARGLSMEPTRRHSTIPRSRPVPVLGGDLVRHHVHLGLVVGHLDRTSGAQGGPQLRPAGVAGGRRSGPPSVRQRR